MNERRDAAFKAIANNSPISIYQIQKRLNMTSYTAAKRPVLYLLKLGLIEKMKYRPGFRKGPPFFELSPQGFILALDLNYDPWRILKIAEEGNPKWAPAYASLYRLRIILGPVWDRNTTRHNLMFILARLFQALAEKGIDVDDLSSYFAFSMKKE